MAFQWKAWSISRFSRHYVFVFFFIHFHTQPSFQNFLYFFFSSPIFRGARSQCLKAAGRDQRWTAGMYRMEWNLKKEHCFTLDDDGLRLHCDKTKKAPPTLQHSCREEKDFLRREAWLGCKGLAKPGGV
ncbi:Uncharacterized protein HZ326_0749 [Fusarium oxysporum f. sp. albedinis]|nr:Uncharacterized protein HZ326_0749 [Fusarium oxysporum f. sp. albedinis]